MFKTFLTQVFFTLIVLSGTIKVDAQKVIKVFEKKGSDAAKEYCNKQKGEKKIAACIALGDYHFRKKNMNASHDAYSIALDGNPQKIGPKIGKIGEYYLQKYIKEGKSDYFINEAIKYYELAYKHDKKILQKQYLTIANAFLTNKDTKNAALYFAKGYPNETKLLHEAYLRIADTLFHNFQFIQSVDYYEKALADNEEQLKAKYLLNAGELYKYGYFKAAIKLYQKALNEDELKQKFTSLGEEQAEKGNMKAACKFFITAGLAEKAKSTITAFIAQKKYTEKVENAVREGRFASAVYYEVRMANLYEQINDNSIAEQHYSMAAQYILKVEYADIEPFVDSTILAFARENELKTGLSLIVEKMPKKKENIYNSITVKRGHYSFPENYNYLVTNNRNFNVETSLGRGGHSVMKNNAFQFFETGRYLDKRNKKLSHVRQVDWNPVTKERKTSDLGYIVDFVFYGGMAITNDDKHLILGGYNSIQKWDVENNKLLHTYCVDKEEERMISPFYHDEVVSFSVTNDNKWIVASIKYDTYVLDIKTFEVIKTFDFNGKIDITSDNKIIAVGKKGKIRLYDYETGIQIGEIKLEKEETVDFVSFTNEGNAMLISSHGGSKGKKSSMKLIKFYNPYNAIKYSAFQNIESQQAYIHVIEKYFNTNDVNEFVNAEPIIRQIEDNTLRNKFYNRLGDSLKNHDKIDKAIALYLLTGNNNKIEETANELEEEYKYNKAIKFYEKIDNTQKVAELKALKKIMYRKMKAFDDILAKGAKSKFTYLNNTDFEAMQSIINSEHWPAIVENYDFGRWFTTAINNEMSAVKQHGEKIYNSVDGKLVIMDNLICNLSFNIKKIAKENLTDEIKYMDFIMKYEQIFINEKKRLLARSAKYYGLGLTKDALRLTNLAEIIKLNELYLNDE